jgi:hypothetical protein
MLNFEYFDGEMWWPTWDSSNSIPIAVNVTIGFFQPDFPGEELVVENMDTFSTTIWTACYREVENANITGETGEPASGQ